MSAAITKENFFWHKVQSITGLLPIGYYVLQHLVLNTFSLAGEEKFNSVILFFESMPIHLLLAMEICLIWVPMLFHALYGMVIISHAQYNVGGGKYNWSQNRMYTLQRWTGMFLFLFIILHVLSTTGAKYYYHSPQPVEFQAWHEKLTSLGGLWLLLYVVGVLAASYHLAYGVWNFCIRWGITISDRAQMKVQKFSFGMFVVTTVIGWAALGGFLLNRRADPGDNLTQSTPVTLPMGTVH